MSRHLPGLLSLRAKKSPTTSTPLFRFSATGNSGRGFRTFDFPSPQGWKAIPTEMKKTKPSWFMTPRVVSSGVHYFSGLRFFSSRGEREGEGQAERGIETGGMTDSSSLPLSGSSTSPDQHLHPPQLSGSQFSTSSVPVSPGASTSSTQKSPSAIPASVPIKKSRFLTDLGLRYLIPEWKRMLNGRGLVQDTFAGITVAFVAVPLSLAIAVASGVPPGVGLITAIVGGSVAAIWGGTSLAVTGPAAAMSVLVCNVISHFGLPGLVFVTLATGCLQFLTGFLKLGSLIKIIPQTVIAGFSAGVGGIILCTQLPKIFGIPAPQEASHLPGVLGLIQPLLENFPQAQWAPLVVALTTLGLSILIPKINRKLPAVVIGVTIASLLSTFLPTPIPLVGTLPDSLPWPLFPAFPNAGILGLIEATLMVFSLASLESLLSSSVADRMNKDKEIKKHDPNQELVGQGMSNIAVSFFGGMPVTSVIARTTLNIQAGAKTRRSPLVMSLVLFLAISVLNPVISSIPMAALSGVLLSSALRLLHPAEAIHIFKSNPSEILPFLVTFVTILLKDLVVGVEMGVVTAALMSLRKQGGWFKKVSFTETQEGEVMTIKLKGPITCFSSLSFGAVGERLELVAPPTPNSKIIFDLEDVEWMDITGADMFLELTQHLEDKGYKGQSLSIVNLSDANKKLLLGFGGEYSKKLLSPPTVQSKEAASTVKIA